MAWKGFLLLISLAVLAGCARVESTWVAGYPYISYHMPVYKIRLYTDGRFSGEASHSNGGSEGMGWGRVYGEYERDANRIKLTGKHKLAVSGETIDLDLEFVWKDVAFQSPSGMVLTEGGVD
ncbi:MAG: hypothetical protein ABIV13_03030 [Fimbriimonadales bacterium]